MSSKLTASPRHPLWKENLSQGQEMPETDDSNQTATPETYVRVSIRTRSPEEAAAAADRLADWRARNKRPSVKR